MKSVLIVIGGGPGGYVAAIRAAQLGLRTVLVERAALGGTCLNRGCIPTKTLLHSASLYRQVLHSAAFGVTASDAGFDYAVMDERRRQVVEQLRRGVEGLLKGNGVEVIHGSAVIEGPGRVRVGEAIYESEHILVAVGARPALPPIPGLDLPGVVTSDGLLGEGMYHPRLTIIGGGVIGMEFASLYSALGAQVTVLEAMDRVLPTMDKEIAQNLSMLMKRRGVKLCTGARVEQVMRTGEGLRCAYTSKEKAETVAADAVLVSTGRTPNTEGLCGPGLDLGLDRGAIPVNERFDLREGHLCHWRRGGGQHSAGTCGLGPGDQRCEYDRGKRAAHEAERHPRLCLHRTGDRLCGAHRGPGQGGGDSHKGKQVPDERQWAEHHCRRGTGLYQGGVPCRDRHGAGGAAHV